MDKHGVSEEFQVFLLIYIQQINKTSALESWHLEALFNICKKTTPDFKAAPEAMAKAPERLELDPEQPKFLLLAPRPQASQAQARMFSVESLMKHQLKLRETVVETSHIP